MLAVFIPLLLGRHLELYYIHKVETTVDSEQASQNSSDKLFFELYTFLYHASNFNIILIKDFNIRDVWFHVCKAVPFIHSHIHSHIAT